MVLCRKAETDPESAWAAKPCSARLESQVELMEPSLGHLQVCCLLSPWVFLLVLGGQALSRGMSLGLVELFPQQGGHSILSNCSSLFCSDLCCISGCVCVGGCYSCLRGKLCPCVALPMGLCACGSLSLRSRFLQVSVCVSRELISFSVSQARSRCHCFLCVRRFPCLSVLEPKPQERVSCSQPARLTSMEPEAQSLWPGLLPGPSAMTLCLPLASHCLPVPSCPLQVPVFNLFFMFSLFIFKEAIPLSLVVPVF